MPVRAGRGPVERELPGALRPCGTYPDYLVLALGNAVLRELFVTAAVGTYPAHVVSTATLLVALAVVVAMFVRRVPGQTRLELAAVGALWAGLTVAFELLFGHYVAGGSWSALLGQYDLAAGMVWVFVPLFLLVGPLSFGLYLAE